MQYFPFSFRGCGQTSKRQLVERVNDQENGKESDQAFQLHTLDSLLLIPMTHNPIGWGLFF
jgi:hypothetical protein